MKFRSLFIGAAVLAGVALMPSPARAGGTPTCAGAGYFVTLGLGGNLNGCFFGVLRELGEDAGLVSDQFYWLGNFGAAGGAPNNAPTVPGTQFFNDDCGSSGGGTFAFCPVTPAETTGLLFNPAGEMVLGLRVPDPNSTGPNSGPAFYWVYSGAAARNAFPAPTGFQQVLMQLTVGGVDDPGQFLFGWEDLNTGCTALAANNFRYAEEDLADGPKLDSQLNTCVTLTPGGNSDSDYNDSYIRFSITGIQLENPVPEPMTMSLMALGLVGLGGASLRRRKNRSK